MTASITTDTSVSKRWCRSETGGTTINPRTRGRSRTASVERLLGGRTGLVSGVEFDQPVRDGDPTLGTDIDTAAIGRLLPQESDEDPDPAAGGKGRTVTDGLLTAVGEFAERYCAFWPSETHSHRIVEATYEELSADEDAVVDFEYLTPFDPSDVREQGTEPFDRTTEIRWVAGTNLFDGDEILVPAPLVTLGEATGGSPYFFSSSNGLACGPDLPSALLGAAYEVVERDAVMRSWYRREPPTRLALDEWPELNRERRRFGNDFAEYRLRRFETDIDAHAVGAVYVDERDRAPKFVLAASADLDFERAARDALVEAAQGVQSMKTSVAYEGYPDVESPNVMNLEENFKYYVCPENFEEVSIYFEGDRAAVPRNERRQFEDSREELNACLDALGVADVTPIAFDLTTPGVRDAGMRVARLFVPELVALCPPALPPAGHPALADDELTERGHPFP